MEFENLKINLAQGLDNLVVTVSNDMQPEDSWRCIRTRLTFAGRARLYVSYCRSAASSFGSYSRETTPEPVPAPAGAKSPSTISKSSELVTGSVTDPMAAANLPYRWWMTDPISLELSRNLPRFVNLPMAQASFVQEAAKEFYRSWKRNSYGILIGIATLPISIIANEIRLRENFAATNLRWRST